MMKAYIIIADDGTEVIDNTLEAEIRIAAMDDLENRYIREQKREADIKRKFARNPLLKFACFCGLV